MSLEGPKKTGDPKIDNTLLIYFVAPQMEGTRPLREGDKDLIELIAKKRVNGEFSKHQLWLLDQIGLNKAIDDSW